MLLQTPFAQPAVEAFDVCVFHRLSRTDVEPGDPGAEAAAAFERRARAARDGDAASVCVEQIRPLVEAGVDRLLPEALRRNRSDFEVRRST
ncbi:hypothetical protein [Paraburkholderia tropica]|uniref:hypothetical protein n=1 Tax=Paraburkholderia tropica TaxID=92647 RepID=UPI003AFB66B7